MLKKILSWMLVITLAAGVAIGGTLAYYTDRDSKANVFTVGDVSIRLDEVFEHGSELVPGVKIEKEATITNTGINDAWVWMTLAVPTALDAGADNAADNVIHWNVPGAFWDDYHATQKYIDSAIEAGYLPEGSTAVAADKTWDVGDEVAMQEVEIDGVKYNLYTLLYNSAIEPNETTNIGLATVFMDARVDIDPEGNWHFVEDGVASDINWNSETNGDPVIYVSAYAMQKENFETAKAAYDAYNKQWADKGTEYAEPATVVRNQEELVAALSEGGPVVLTEDITITDTVNIEKAAQIDLNGHNLTVSVLEAKADTEISNGTLSHGRSTYPAVSVSAGTLTLNHVDVVCENYCNLVTGNSGAQASEYVGVQVWDGACVMNDSTITVKADVVRYSNTVIGVGINQGKFTMNGGYIEVINPGSTRVNYESALFASSNGEKEVTLNGVTLKLGEKGVNMYAWGGNTTVNTTDADGSWDGKVSTAYGGAYTVNYID